MDRLTSPHDKFFKEVFTRRATTKEFLELYLPSEVVGLLDLDSLEPIKDTFIDEHLKEYYSDLIFKVFLKDDSRGFIYILFEHKSFQEKLTAFHLLRYMVKIWEMCLKGKGKHEFTPIIPLVLYHGETKWKQGLNFRDILDYPGEIVRFIPDFEYLLWDTARHSDEDIKGEAVLRVALLILKYIFREDLRDRLPGIVRLLGDLSERRTSLEYIETILRYIAGAAPEGNITYKDLERVVEQALPEEGGRIMPTIADSLREQGRKQGLQDGLQQGLQDGLQQGGLRKAREVVIDILEMRFEIAPRSIVERVNAISDPSILRSLHRKAVTVDSLEKFGQQIDLILQ